MNELSNAIEKLCSHLGIENDSEIIHAYYESYKQGLHAVSCFRVPTNFFNLSLEEKALIMPIACKVSQLTKCLLYENRLAPLVARDIGYSRFYLIIYQYERKFSEPKFSSYIKRLRDTDEKLQNLTKSSYKWQFVDENIAEKMLGSVHNGMSPIGLIDKEIPVFIDSHIKDDYIFVGGLQPFVKAKIRVTEVLHVYKSNVVELTDAIDK